MDSKLEIIIAFELSCGKIYVGKKPNNDLNKGKTIMQEGIIISSSKCLPEGKNIKERIAKKYFNTLKKKEISFKFYKYDKRYEINFSPETFIYK